MVFPFKISNICLMLRSVLRLLPIPLLVVLDLTAQEQAALHKAAASLAERLDEVT